VWEFQALSLREEEKFVEGGENEKMNEGERT